MLTTTVKLVPELVLKPSRDYQPQPNTCTMSQHTCARCPETSRGGAPGRVPPAGFEPATPGLGVRRSIP